MVTLTSWPTSDDGTPHYLIACSCGHKFTGTLAEINREAMRHDDSPWHNYIVAIRGRIEL